MNLLDVFEPIRINEGSAPEFPLDILPPGTHAPVHYVDQDGNPVTVRGGDYVYVPMAARDDRQLADAAARLLVHAAFQDGRPLPFDEEGPQGVLTLRLVSLMARCLRRVAGGVSASTHRPRVTDLFFSEDLPLSHATWKLIPSCGIKARPVARDEWAAAANALPMIDVDANPHLRGRTNLLLGVDLTRFDSFSRPFRETESGLVVLDPRRVIAGVA